jgi:murein DD-endopeptidase MepM/ murein hydrolase activator NlpD
MFKKKITFLVIPDSSGVSRQLRIPVAFFYIAASVVLFLMVSSLFFGAEFLSARVSELALAQFKMENSRLHDKFEQFSDRLAEAEARYRTLVQKEVAIRNLFNLPEISTEERQLGVGGPGSYQPLALSETDQRTFKTEVQLDQLLRLSRFESEQFGEVERSVMKVKDRLDHTPSIWPTEGWTSRGFGFQFDPFTGQEQMHTGIDVANRIGTPIIAPASGRVIGAGAVVAGMGTAIVIDHGYGLQTRYGHLSKALVKPGQKVNRGDLIGYMGSTGYSTGPHLHYEVFKDDRAVDPRNFILNKM